jgi:hypothetical protein
MLAGVLVSAQVYFVQSVGAEKFQRYFVALYPLPEGHRLHPRDFSLQSREPGDPEWISDQKGSYFWGLPVLRNIDAGEVLSTNMVEWEARPQTPSSSRRSSKRPRIEIIEESDK